MSNVVSKGLNIPDTLDAETTKIVLECFHEGINKRTDLWPEEDNVVELLNARLPEPPIGVSKMEYLFLIVVANLSGKLTEEQYLQLFMNVQTIGLRQLRQELYTLSEEIL